MDIIAKNCPILVDDLSSQGDAKFAQFKNSKFGFLGIMQLDLDFSQGLIPVIGNADLQSKVNNLLNTSLKVFFGNT